MLKKVLVLGVCLLLASIILAYLETNLFFVKLRVKNTASQDSAAHPIPEISEKIDYENDAKLAKALEKYGAKNLMANLVKKSDGGASFDCHQEAHRVGRLAYELKKEAAFAECSAACHSGCYHGAMEALLREKGTENISQIAKNTCVGFDTFFGYFECLHGLGHGILAYSDYNLPEALKTCKELDDDFLTGSCYGGAFMENVVTGLGYGARGQNHATEWVNDDPYFPCNAISQDYQTQYHCYQMQTSWMLNLHNRNFEPVINECLKAPEKFIGVCFKSYGRDAAGVTLRNVNEIVDLCSKIPKEHQGFCSAGAVHAVIDFWGPELKNQATELCRQFQREAKKTCYKVLANRLPTILNNKKDRSEICKSFEPEYQKWCRFPWTLVNIDRW